jgi:hypothetical protein
MDATELYVKNLLEAFNQLNQFLAVATAASLSALALEPRTARASRRARRRAYSEEKPIELPMGIVPLLRPDAQLVFLGISFIAGLMDSYAAESAAGIVNKLACVPDILEAACTYPSVATAPVGIPILGAALPLVFAIPVFVRKRWRLREEWVLMKLVVFAAPFIVIAMVLGSMPCRSS